MQHHLLRFNTEKPLHRPLNLILRYQLHVHQHHHHHHDHRNILKHVDLLLYHAINIQPEKASGLADQAAAVSHFLEELDEDYLVQHTKDENKSEYVPFLCDIRELGWKGKSILSYKEIVGNYQDNTKKLNTGLLEEESQGSLFDCYSKGKLMKIIVGKDK